MNDPFELRALEFRDKTVRAVVKNFGSEFGQSTRLICFSEDWTSPVMWSHYAASHQGICLGFDVRRSAVRRVHYKSKRLAIAYVADDPFALSSAMQRLLVKTKCREWAYEKERRLIVPLEKAIQDSGLFFRSFDEKLRLREVIIGAKCGVSLQHIRDQLIGHSDVCAFQARLAWQHFKVVPVESSVP